MNFAIAVHFWSSSPQAVDRRELGFLAIVFNLCSVFKLLQGLGHISAAIKGAFKNWCTKKKPLPIPRNKIVTLFVEPCCVKVKMVSFSGWLVVLALSLSCAVEPGYSVILTKTCLKLEEDFNFKEAEYVGTWYEVRRLYDPSDPEQEDCVVMNYQAREKGSYDTMQSHQITEEGAPIYVSGTAEPQVFEDAKVPRFLERLNTSSNADPDILIQIVAIDYTSYAIVYSCASFNATHFTESARVLSRQSNLDKHHDDIINIYLEQHFKRPDHKWRATQQTADFCKPSMVEDMGKKSSSNGVSLPAVINLLGMMLLVKLLH
uniref:Lipocalin/cytosolic fatty-acid binding domain-containing protein n=1 Tax=Anopheles atroparvus TaxID=41427 RepID=A0A182JGZ4_ANOAO